jgi:Flp pilus assembly protein TadG
MRLKNESGQALVEFALILPLLLILLCGIIDFGWIFRCQLTADSAAREAARYTAIHYYDSSTDNDAVIAQTIVESYAPTLAYPTVTLAKSSDAITVTITSQADILTPLIAAFFQDGKVSLTARCTMRLE